jgi:hypothetical protein
MGVGTFYSTNDNMIVDKELGMEFYNNIKEKIEDKEFKSLKEVIAFFHKEGIEYEEDSIDWLWDSELNEFGVERWLDFEMENETDMYDASQLFIVDGKNVDLVKDTYAGSVESDMTVYSELRAESELFASHIEVGTYDDNYHSAVMATSASEALNEYINDKDGDFSEEFMLDLLYELDDEVGKFMIEIKDETADLDFYSEKSVHQDINDYTKTYAELIEQIKNFIVNENPNFKKLPEVLKMINKLNDYTKALNLLKSKISSTTEEELNTLFETIQTNPELQILSTTEGLYDTMYKLLKTDIDRLETNVNNEIFEYFNKMIAYNEFGKFRVRTSSYTSEIAQYFNTEEDMKKVLSELPKEVQSVFKRDVATYKKKWERVAMPNKK